MKYFFGILSAVCVLLFFGIIGGVEQDSISVVEGLLLTPLALFGSILFGFIAAVCDMKG